MGMMLVWVAALGVVHGAVDEAVPVAVDARLRVRLFADEASIVTPIGLAVDGRGRVFAVESHTHMPPRDYDGPPHDRVKRLEDRDGDGRADDVAIFAEGFRDAMNLAFGPDGTLYLCHRTGVVALPDRDGDGRADEAQEILRLETPQTYPHSCLLSIAFGPDGRLYVGRGNLGGEPWTLIAADGSRLAGYGEGGAIVRLGPDGSDLEPFATGFWNPFGLAFDGQGRLFAVDNDPDARGPNRLVHVVEGGDYGFRALFGPDGLHPFQAWDGELPGTLPLAGPTGEAPSGLIDAARACLPADYRDCLLSTSWGEHTIERLRLSPRGASVAAVPEVVIRGGRDFRPVAIDTAPDGTIYVSDWVLHDYPNHGRGRIWRIDVPPGQAAEPPRPPDAVPPISPSRRTATISPDAAPAERYAAWLKQLTDPDPFVRTAAVAAAAQPAYRERLSSDLDHDDPRVRLGILVALRHAGTPPDDDRFRRWLDDPDPDVRRMALAWIAERGRGELAADLRRVLTREVTPDLLRAYLAASQALEPATLAAVARREPGFRIRRAIDPRRLAELLEEPALHGASRALVIRLADALPDRSRVRVREAIVTALDDDDLACRVEAVRTLGRWADSAAGEALWQIACDRGEPATLRADAVNALAGLGEDRTDLSALLDDPEPEVRREAARALRAAVHKPAVRAALQRAAEQPRDQDDELSAQARFALDPAADRPRDDQAWQTELGSGGSVSAGRRVFLDRAIGCVDCHTAEGRGGSIGPDLSTIGRTFGRDRLLESILHPSAEIAQAYRPTRVATTDGRVYVGLQFHFRSDDHVTLLVQDGASLSEIALRLDELEEYGPSPTSLMPEDLAARLSVPDLRHLLAYLVSLR
ncbi:MAG: cytochrome c [Isosphaeraceae bacterium]|jgi:putative membrane-bound dehydrogenase-like protein|nr:MAG: cytochrome c [Isosphaeraceae bacterium]